MNREAVSGLVQLMAAAAPPGRPHLDDADRRRLRSLTHRLIAARPDAAAEHDRFLAIGTRGLALPAAALTERLRDATVLVTGGTGCIGSALLRELAAFGPGRLVSVSRGVTGSRADESVEYAHADISNRDALVSVVEAVRPSVIFHVAAQRDPGLAETEVHRTLSTNILGTRNVLSAAAAAAVPQVVYASTGKALRPYSPDMYTASKRAAEWITTEAARAGGLLCSAARFTHVVDNSIIYRRLLGWAADPDATIRLHSPDIAFYAQSARESAQLLLLALLGARRGELRVHAITDLGWPVSLLDLTLSVLGRRIGETGASDLPPVYFSGYDAGYEEVPFPGLYDPLTAGDVSPLLNAFEAAAATGSPSPQADAFRLELARDPRPHTLLAALVGACERTREPDLLRRAMNKLSWALLDTTLRAAPGTALARSAALAKAHWDTMGADHRRVLEMISDSAGAP
ncbi:MAG TPA: polysaccharide biosynthesis protein [Trebonia sp.]|nr:polysaccharide biosynthesis protein [Trebonia sp.]